MSTGHPIPAPDQPPATATSPQLSNAIRSIVVSYKATVFGVSVGSYSENSQIYSLVFIKCISLNGTCQKSFDSQQCIIIVSGPSFYPEGECGFSNESGVQKWIIDQSDHVVLYSPSYGPFSELMGLQSTGEEQPNYEETHTDTFADPTTGTTVRLNRTRTCVGGGKFKKCGPYSKHDADIHLGPAPAETIVKGVQQATQAISTALAASGVGFAAAAWTLAIGELVGIGYNVLKNSDGSVDMHVNLTVVTAHGVPITLDPVSANAILQGL